MHIALALGSVVAEAYLPHDEIEWLWSQRFQVRRLRPRQFGSPSATLVL